jgi:hypothetical protein
MRLDSGLFMTMDGGRTLQPRPHSGGLHADHLAHCPPRPAPPHGGIFESFLTAPPSASDLPARFVGHSSASDCSDASKYLSSTSDSSEQMHVPPSSL